MRIASTLTKLAMNTTNPTYLTKGQFILNIGMVASKGHYSTFFRGLPLDSVVGRDAAIKQILTIVRNCGFNPTDVIAYEGDEDNEPTMIVYCAKGLSRDFDASIGRMGVNYWVSVIAQSLHQDCIAVYDTDTNEGALMGDFASEWGEFNPEYFLL